MPVMQNLFATCWFSLNMHKCILQYKSTFSINIYIHNYNSHYFSLSRHFIHINDSVSLSMWYLQKTITFYQHFKRTFSDTDFLEKKIDYFFNDYHTGSRRELALYYFVKVNVKSAINKLLIIIMIIINNHIRIQSECEKIRTRNTPNTDTFHAVSFKHL